MPFPTVLSLDESAPAQEADAAIARSGESSRQHSWRDELLKTGIRGKGRIAMWLLDPDYDDRSLLPRQVFFRLAGKEEGWRRFTKDIRAELDEILLDQFHGTVSLPFEAG